MAKALLINPGFELTNYKKRDHYVFPFGLGYIAAYAEKKGHEVVVWDIYGTQIDFKDVIKRIKEIDFKKYDIIGITGIVNQYLYIKVLARILKKITSLNLVLGGPLASYSWEVIMKTTKIDICVIGEGEQTFSELLNGVELKNIDGIAYKEEGETKRNKDRTQIRNLDIIGYPAIHLFDIDFYCANTGMMDVVRPFYKKYRVMAMITTRGCPYNCRFCSKSYQGVRMKSLDFLFKEIDVYKNNFKVDAIHFVDELLLLNKKRFLEFCQRIKKYNIKWDCQARINLVDEEVLKAMKDANGVCIGFGIESASQKILDAMDKQYKAADIKKILNFCMKIQLPVKIQLIYGYPGESWSTLNETIGLFKNVRLPGRRFGVITPLPGSRLYDVAKQDGFIGNSKFDKISEIEYLEFLSKHSGWVSPELFYNRTEFSNEEFYINLTKAENLMFNNFIKFCISHPLYIIRNLGVYKYYLRNWWTYRNRIFILSFPKWIRDFIIKPREVLKQIRLYIKRG